MLGCKSLQRAPIDGNAEAGPSGMRTMPPACSIGLVSTAWRKGCSERSNSRSGSCGRVARRVVRQHGEQLQGGGEADAGAPHMRHAAHAEGRGHVGDLLGLRQAADGAHIGLDDVDGARGQHIAEVPAREPGLAAGDGDRLAATHLRRSRRGPPARPAPRTSRCRNRRPGGRAQSPRPRRSRGWRRASGRPWGRWPRGRRGSAPHPRRRRSRFSASRRGSPRARSLAPPRRCSRADRRCRAGRCRWRRRATSLRIGPPISTWIGAPKCLPLMSHSATSTPTERRDGETLLPLVAEEIVEVHPDAVAGERVGADEVRAEGGDDGRIERRRPEALAPAVGAVLADDLDQAGAAHAPCC